ncbi:DUF2624 family protein [Bacillus solitudinis]|uniref:DUF2624 family protein n=1 Tax=Bacillus solitudinis TaxID=2014074 RepID=UPI000C23FE94|nr:DUF2624 family protein [Bacillus solitudinis]
MNSIMQQLINQKVNSISPQDLLSLASQHKVSITMDQANDVVAILRSEKIDIANQEQVHRLLNRLQTEIDPYVSKVVTQLLDQFSHYLT